MQEKLAQCIKMLKFIGKDSYRFNANYLRYLPIKPEHSRSNKNFTLHTDGTIEYHGISDKYNITPTDEMVDYVFKLLKSTCDDCARQKIMKRLVQHELKYNGLDFLITDAQCNPNLH